MRLRRTHIIATLATIILVAGFVFAPHEAHAQGVLTSTAIGAGTGAAIGSFVPVVGTAAGAVVGGALGFVKGLTNFDVIPATNAILEYLFNNLGLPLANMFVQITGYLLNATMTLTLNMNTLVSSSGGIIDSTWSIIRDLSSIIIIFFLLYTSIEIIIQKSDSKVQHLIIMVAIAGILINFSLFFTKIAVDASNLVSLAFYRAITPTGSAQWNGDGAYLTSAINDGGLSNVFMNALQLQKVYNPAQTPSGTTETNPWTIIAAGIGGMAIMIIAALSFLAAAILFTVRIAFLIILMAFSPVYFVGMIVPKIKEKLSDRWEGALINQCLIMPIYMLFMYVAMRVITNPTFKNVINPSTTVASTGVGIVNAGVVGTVIQYIISIILIMIPLIAALTYASFGKDFAQDMKKKVGGALGKQTLGRAAHVAGNSKVMQDFVSRNPRVGVALQNRLSGVADYGFGDGKKGFASDQKKIQKDYETAYKSQDKEGKERMLKNMQLRNLPIDNIPLLRSTPIIGNMLKKAANFKVSESADEFATKKIGEIETEARNEEASKNIDKKLEEFGQAMESNNTVLGHLETQISRGTSDRGKPYTAQELAGLVARKASIIAENRDVTQKISAAKEQKTQYAKKEKTVEEQVKEAVDKKMEEKGESDKGGSKTSGDKP